MKPCVCWGHKVTFISGYLEAPLYGGGGGGGGQSMCAQKCSPGQQSGRGYMCGQRLRASKCYDSQQSNRWKELVKILTTNAVVTIE